MKYLIEFDFSPDDDGPRSLLWAGMAGDAPGFAPQQETAIEFDTENEATQFMIAAYGPSLREVASVVELPAIEDSGG